MGWRGSYRHFDLLFPRLCLSDKSPGYSGGRWATICDNRIRNAIFGRKLDQNLRSRSYCGPRHGYEGRLKPITVGDLNWTDSVLVLHVPVGPHQRFSLSLYRQVLEGPLLQEFGW